MTYTPGPWKVEDDGYTIVSPNGIHIADLNSPLNARLIAAAPELLEALKEILDCPYTIDEATVPRAGIEAAPEQVVGILSVSIVRIRKAQAAIRAAE